MIEYIFTFIIYHHNKHSKKQLYIIKMFISFGMRICYTSTKNIKISIHQCFHAIVHFFLNELFCYFWLIDKAEMFLLILLRLLGDLSTNISWCQKQKDCIIGCSNYDSVVPKGTSSFLQENPVLKELSLTQNQQQMCYNLYSPLLCTVLLVCLSYSQVVSILHFKFYYIMLSSINVHLNAILVLTSKKVSLNAKWHKS